MSDLTERLRTWADLDRIEAGEVLRHDLRTAAERIAELEAELADERARSGGIARNGCPNCVNRPDDATPLMRCVRCGTGYFPEDHRP